MTPGVQRRLKQYSHLPTLTHQMRQHVKAFSFGLLIPLILPARLVPNPFVNQTVTLPITHHEIGHNNQSNRTSYSERKEKEKVIQSRKEYHLLLRPSRPTRSPNLTQDPPTHVINHGHLYTITHFCPGRFVAGGSSAATIA